MWVESPHLLFLSSSNLDKFRNLEVVLETVSFSFFYTFPVLSTWTPIPESTQIHLCHIEITDFCLDLFKLLLNQYNYK